MWWHKTDGMGGVEGRNVWLLISGPSGVGKSTLIEQMLGEYYPRLQPVITATTRAPRPGEEHGRQYYFMTPAEFSAAKEAGNFLETIERHGASYGTLKYEIESKLAAGHDLIMHIDWQGRRCLKEMAGVDTPMARAMVSVFVKPESTEDLRLRLVRRARNTPEEIEHRVRTAADDMPHAVEYNYSFTTHTYQEDLNRLKAIYLAEKARV